MELKIGKNILGKNADCTIHIPDERISWQHCCFEVDDGSCTIQDLDSTNKTMLGSLEKLTELSPNISYQLNHGDTIVVGSDIVCVFLCPISKNGSINAASLNSTRNSDGISSRMSTAMISSDEIRETMVGLMTGMQNLYDLIGSGSMTGMHETSRMQTTFDSEDPQSKISTSKISTAAASWAVRRYFYCCCPTQGAQSISNFELRSQNPLQYLHRLLALQISAFPRRPQLPTNREYGRQHPRCAGGNNLLSDEELSKKRVTRMVRPRLLAVKRTKLLARSGAHRRPTLRLGCRAPRLVPGRP